MIRTTAKPTYIAPVILVLAAAIELTHDLLGRTWAAMDQRWVLGFGIGLGALWIAGAIGLVLRRSWGWLVGLSGALMLVVHGSVLRLGEETMGIVYFVLGAVAVVQLGLHARAYGFRFDPVERPSLV
ncbi:MAG: hypothetical protein HYV09_34295 [Deltaproteobacteria bacterium]|nr:hypothetical protein [Deltaproteobacteria bacterium]